MGRSLQLTVVVLLAALVVVGAIVVSSGGETKLAATGPTAGQEVAALYDGIPQQGMRLGRRDAPATLVEIADLQCPFCARYSTQVLPTIVDEYVRTGKVAYELRIRSFLGDDSVRAAGAAAEAARQDRLYQFTDLFFRNQGTENSGYVTADFVRRIAQQAGGLDADRVVGAAEDPRSQSAVARNEAFARDIGSTGTPDFYLRKNGRLTPVLPQGGSPEAYAAAIDAALAS